MLLDHGIKALIEESEELFKKNITQALVIKLNESVQETKNEISKKLLFKEEFTPETAEMSDFINFLESFTPGNYTFKNGSNINITESDVKLITKLFESLNQKNRLQMVSEILTDGGLFKKHIEFSQKVTNLI